MRSESLGSIDVLVWLAEPLLRAGVQAMLRDAEDLNIVESAQRACNGRAHVVVTDWASGLQFAQEATRRDVPFLFPHSRILIVSSRAPEHAAAVALRTGVHGLFLARGTAEQLVEAIRTVARGRSYVCPELAQRLTTSALEQLTPREDQVLRLIAHGMCNKAIARQLGIAVGTVKTHVKGILGKLEASSRTEAASIAAERGIVSVAEFRAGRSAWSSLEPALMASARHGAHGPTACHFV